MVCELGEVIAKPFCKNPVSRWSTHLWSTRKSRKEDTGVWAFLPLGSGMAGELRKAGGLPTIHRCSVNNPGAGTPWIPCQVPWVTQSPQSQYRAELSTVEG